ncbi:hypothetical protein Tco_0902928 [Tanacetum coccineum]
MNISDSEDTNTAHLPKIKTRPDWLKPVPEEDRPAFPEPGCFCKRIRKKKLSKAALEGLAFKVVRPFHDNNISLPFQMEECHLLLTNQVDLVNPEGHRVVPDVSKLLPLGGPPGQLKVAQYLDFGVEEPVPLLWIESEREYDTDAYDISHWWFKRKEFYTTRQSAPSDRSPPDPTVRIPHSDYKEYKISEADFKNLHPNDFKDLYLLHLQGQLNHLSGADKVHLFNTVNLILDKLDHMVKDFKLFKFNPGMETRIWSKDDRRRSKEFMENIRVIPKYQGEDGNPARANIKQALGSYKDGDGDGDTQFQQSQSS